MMRKPDPTNIRAVFDAGRTPDATKPVPLVLRRARWWHRPNCFADPVTGAVRLTYGEIEQMIRLRDPEEKKAERELRDQEFAARRALKTAKALIEAAPIPASEWAEEVYDSGRERVFSDLDEWREYLTEEENPAWIWATKPDTWEPGVERILEYIEEDANENAFEDAADRVDFAPLKAFLEDWAPKQRQAVFWEDRSRVIVLDQARYEADVAAARNLVGGAA